MGTNSKKEILGKVGKSCSWVYKSDFVLVRTVNHMVIQTHASQINFKIFLLQHRKPLHVFQMALTVIAPNLWVATILT